MKKILNESQRGGSGSCWRKSILFDISVWNTLADGKTEEAIHARDTLIDLCERELIFCPLSGPMVWELRKQTGRSFYRTTELMERLSLNVSFRRIDKIFEHEISQFLKFLLNGEFEPVSNNQIYGSLLSYISDGFNIEHELDSNSVETKKILGHMSSHAINLTLTSFMDMVGEKSSPGPDIPPEYQATNIRRREVTKGNRHKAKRLEQEFLAQRIVIPKMNEIRSKLPMDQQLYIVEKVKNFPVSKKYGTCLEHILGYLPALSSYARIHAATGLDINRKDSMNDFYDREFMIYGLSYSSLFSAFDGWVASIVDLVKKDGDIGAFGYSGDLPDLRSKLEKIKI